MDQLGSYPETDLDAMEVFGKFVFVGVTANGVMPQIATPVGLLEPHKIQAALSESLLIQDSPYVPAWSLLAELSILLVSVLLVWFVLQYAGIYLGLFITGNIFLATAGAGYYLIQSGLLIDVTWTLIAQFITGATAFYIRFREQFKLRLQIKKQFEHYLDPRQVKNYKTILICYNLVAKLEQQHFYLLMLEVLLQCQRNLNQKM